MSPPVVLFFRMRVIGKVTQLKLAVDVCSQSIVRIHTVDANTWSCISQSVVRLQRLPRDADGLREFAVKLYNSPVTPLRRLDERSLDGVVTNNIQLRRTGSYVSVIPRLHEKAYMKQTYSIYTYTTCVLSLLHVCSIV